MRKGSLIKLISLLVVLAAVVVLAIVPVLPKTLAPGLPLTQNINLGLDLQGGVHVVLEAQDTKDIKVDQKKMDQLITALERRVNAFGVSEPVVQQEGTRRVVIELAGVDDPESAVQSMIKTAYLEFKGPNGEPILTGSDLSDATESKDTQTGIAEVNLEFSSTGSQKFADATTKYVHQNIAILLDGKVLQNPNVNEPILNGKARITGYKDLQEAHEIATLLRSGALPLKVTVMEKRTVGPTLGKDSLDKSIKAGIIGVALILAFMFLYYRIPGLIANVALIVYSTILLALFTAFHVTLTLPGIAGFILSLGMAVDANVIIFERLKEELKNGKGLRAAIDSGFKRAFVAVVDSNVTTLITGAVLYYFGTSSVKGFALTLSIGILTSMFTAVTMTRWLLHLVADSRITKNTKYYGA